MADVFISYSRKDIAFARLLHDSLTKHGFETWIDWQDIPPSADWLAEVYSAIESADAFIFILSEHSIASEICALEIAHAEKHSKRLIPIVIDDVEPPHIPPQLQQLRWIFFHDQDPLLGPIDDLIETLHRDQEWIKEHTRYLMRALDWQRGDHNPSLLLQGSELAAAGQWLLAAGDHETNPTELHNRFILASRTRAARRQRRVLFAVLGVLALSVVLGLSALVLRNQAVRDEAVRATAQQVAEEEARVRATAEAAARLEAQVRATAQIEAEEQQALAEQQRDLGVSRQLAAEALAHFDEPDLALLLAAQAVDIAQTREALSSLLASLVEWPHLVGIMYSDNQNDITALASSPDGSTLASLDGAGALSLWDPSSQQVVEGPLPVPIDQPLEIVFSPDGTEILIWNAAAQLARCNLAADCHSLQLPQVFDYINEPPLAAGADRLAFASADALVVLSVKGQILQAQSFDYQGRAPQAAAFSPEGGQLAASYAAEDDSPPIVLVWDTNSGEQRPSPLRMPVKLAAITSLAISPDGAYLAIGSLEERQSTQDPDDEGQLYEEIRIWGSDAGSFDPYAYALPEGISHLLRFSSDGLWLLSSDGDRVEAYRWSPERIPLEDSFSLGPAGADLAWTGEQSLIASPAPKGRIYLWDLHKQETTIQHPFEDSNQCYPFALHPDGDRLITNCSDGGFTSWDLASRQRLHTAGRRLFDEDEDFVLEQLAISPDGSTLAAGYGNGAIVLWDTETLTTIGDPMHVHGFKALALVFSPDGRLLFSGSSTGADQEAPTMVAWSVAERRPVARFSYGQVGFVNQLLFLPDGRLAIAGATLGLNTHLLAMSFDSDELSQGDTGSINLHAIASSSDDMLSEVSAAQQLKQLATNLGVMGMGYAPARQSFVLVGSESLATVPLNEGEPRLYTLRGFTSNVEVVTFHPLADQVAYGLHDDTSKRILDTIVLWDLSNQSPLEPALPGYSDKYMNGIMDLAYTLDGKRLISYGHGDNLMLWEVSSDAWHRAACSIANRDLTADEWKTFLDERPYQFTCSESGGGEGDNP